MWKNVSWSIKKLSEAYSVITNHAFIFYFKFSFLAITSWACPIHVAPKLMPPICLHENYNRYEEHNNAIWKSKFSATKYYFLTVTIISYAFSPANEQEPACYTHNNLHSGGAPLLTPTTHHHCAHIHCLVSRNVQQASVNVSGGHFSTWRNSVTHRCFICTSMSDTGLTDCPSAAICHTATACKGMLVGRLNLYYISPTSTSDVVGRHSNISGIFFQSTSH